jgi:hypothetical protein
MALMLTVTDTQARLLAEILQGGGDDWERFYVAHPDDYKEIEKLEYSGLLTKETDNTWVLRLPAMAALRARGDPLARLILEFCDKLLDAARSLHSLAPKEKILVSALATKGEADESKVQCTLRYLRYAPVWQSSEGPPSALISITPSREIIHYKNVESILEWYEEQRASSLYAPAAPPPSTVDDLPETPSVSTQNVTITGGNFQNAQIGVGGTVQQSVTVSSESELTEKLLTLLAQRGPAPTEADRREVLTIVEAAKTGDLGKAKPILQRLYGAGKEGVMDLATKLIVAFAEKYLGLP